MSRRIAARRWTPLLALGLLAGCAVNPATGERQLSLISEEQEIQMGREADQAVVAQLGLYGGEDLQNYIQDLGSRLAAASERPNLPWTFRVVDDPAINAFAIPGGFIYMTRGIMSHLTSEAQLVGILGHEIGHVTARHSVNQMSRAQLAQLGLGLGMVLVPELRPFGDLAGTGLQLLFLKFGRDDEREADDLGFRYMTSLEYDPHALVDVFTMLSRSSGSAEGTRVPDWLSTHPDPADRVDDVRQAIASANADFSEYKTVREPYMTRLDGMVFGPDPREGFFRDGRFYHPELAFQMAFPSGWQTVNQKQAVIGVSQNQDAVAELTLAGESSLQAAMQAFASQQGVELGRTSQDRVNGLDAIVAEFRVQTQQQGTIVGLVEFVAYGGNVYRLLGYSTQQGWSGYSNAIRTTLSSFAPVTDRSILAVEPARIEVVDPGTTLTFGSFVERYPSTVETEKVALANQVYDTETQLAPGQLWKQVTGGRLP